MLRNVCGNALRRGASEQNWRAGMKEGEKEKTKKVVTVKKKEKITVFLESSSPHHHKLQTRFQSLPHLSSHTRHENSKIKWVASRTMRTKEGKRFNFLFFPPLQLLFSSLLSHIYEIRHRLSQFRMFWSAIGKHHFVWSTVESKACSVVGI